MRRRIGPARPRASAAPTCRLDAMVTRHRPHAAPTHAVHRPQRSGPQSDCATAVKSVRGRGKPGWGSFAIWAENSLFCPSFRMSIPGISYVSMRARAPSRQADSHLLHNYRAHNIRTIHSSALGSQLVVALHLPSRIIPPTARVSTFAPRPFVAYTGHRTLPPSKSKMGARRASSIIGTEKESSPRDMPTMHYGSCRTRTQYKDARSIAASWCNIQVLR
jgi:hypothetical protein